MAKEVFIKAIENAHQEILVTKMTEKDSVFDQDYMLEITELQQGPDGPTAINEGCALIWPKAAIIYAGTSACDMTNAEDVMASANFSSASIDEILEVIRKLQKGDENIG